MSVANIYMTRSFAAYNKDEKIRKQSSSGGVFYSLAELVLSQNGVVYGASYNDKWGVEHRAVEKLEDLPRILQSKYVQSAMRESYNYVGENLRDKRKVLFCSTPCQVLGLISYLDTAKIDRRNLITVDFICHGVPSPMVWNKYLKQRAAGKEVRAVNFRDKTNGWRDFSLKIDYLNGEYYINSWHKDPYVQGFIHNLYLRESCYECSFRGIDRIADFTIADFWGVHDLMPDFFDDMGTSIVMAHNENAVRLLEALTEHLIICEISNETVIKTNSPVVKSVSRNTNADRFYRRKHIDIGKDIRRDIKVSFLFRMKRKIKKILHQFD